MNRSDAAHVLALLERAFPATNVDQVTVDVWHRAVLADIPIEEGESIATELIRDGRDGFPGLGEFAAVRRARASAAAPVHRAVGSPRARNEHRLAQIAELRAKLAGAAKEAE